MSNRPGTTRLRAGIGIGTAMLVGLGLTVPLLAGRARSPRQDIPPAAALVHPASTTSPAPPSPSPPASLPAATAATRPEPPRPAASSARPKPPDPATSARGGEVRTLAGAWIAAGARGVDPGPTATPGAATSRAGPPPVRLAIPAIGVAAAVDPTTVNDDGTLRVPTDFARTSYYTGRPVPGDPGPAVIVGHVDGRRGPAVFHRLRKLRPGAEVRVHRADGSVVTFVVERSKQVPKNAFPTDEVYGPTPDPTLRLITCGGSFDRRVRHYRDNIIVFLRLKG